MLTKSLETAQKRVEGNNYDMRKHLLEYDDVINKQREVIYKKRNDILENDSIHESVLDSFYNCIADLVESHIISESKLTEKDYSEILEYFNSELIKKDIELDEINGLKSDDLIEFLYNKLVEEYDNKIKESEVPEEIKNEFEKAISLRVIDTHWMEHINSMSNLREGIYLRGYAQENPLRAYTEEGYEMFQNMLSTIDKQITTYLIKAEIRKNTERKQTEKVIVNNDKSKDKAKTPKKVDKIGRNELCPCGSGKKYKQCCGK
jgi:preprotein translocase subunit SecA